MTRYAFTLIELLVVVSVIAILAAIAVPNFLEAQVRSKTTRTHSDMAVLDAALRAYFADNNVYPPNNAGYRNTLTILGEHPTLSHTMLERGEMPDEAHEQEIVPEEEPDDAHLFMYFDMEKMMEDLDEEEREELLQKMREEFSEEDREWMQMMGSPPGGTPISPDLDDGPGHGRRFLDSGRDLTVLTTPVAYLTGVLPVDGFRNVRGAFFTYTNLSVLDVPPGGPFDGITRRYTLMSPGPNTAFNSPDGPGNIVHGPYQPYDPTNGTVSGGDLFSVGGDAIPYVGGNFGLGMRDRY